MVLPPFAYIGPGAGFAFGGSLVGLVVSFFLTLGSLVAWPFRALLWLARRRQGYRRARIRRLIFLGLDGLDPGLTERYMAEGLLPNLDRLRRQGCYRRLRTTFPALSPVAWSTFATGVSPAKHNIFDFLNRSLRTYVPELAASKVRPTTRVLRIGRWRLPLGRPMVEMRRKSKSFWKVLGEHSISSTILRVPITFPPEEFDGRLLSAMCTPDLRGTQGSFSHFSTRHSRAAAEGGGRYPLERIPGGYRGRLDGPEDEISGSGTLSLPFEIALGASEATLRIAGVATRLRPGEYSPGLRLPFHAAPGFTVRGIARFLITEIEPEFSLYVTPVQIDPEAPALPISHPGYYAAYLAKLLGPFATAGMAEDTWALNEGAIGEAAFLEQAYLTLAEREAMFETALAHTRRGVVACVFDTSDRVQHMFFRHLDSDSPWRDAIRDLYQRMDGVVGRAMQCADENTVLYVLSDHGFRHFRRAVNLNSWLHENGYLALEGAAGESGRYFEGVDWNRTRAYCLGLGGLYLNLRGREARGTVSPGPEARALAAELTARLSGLRDTECDAIAIRQVYETRSLYRGPYLDAAPDLIVGYNDGYRISWDAAVGKTTAAVFEDNRKAWSGDHCVDPQLVPGVLFSNRAIDGDNPGIEDLAPTALDWFGVERPAWMDGRSLARVG